LKINEGKIQGRYPSGQRGQTVNLLHLCFRGSNPLLPILLRRVTFVHGCEKFDTKERKVNRGFTLLELIVVIVILGILATLGYTQYTKIVEKGRSAEARTVIGNLRKNVISYYLTNGSIGAMTQADAGIASGQIPPSGNCEANYYYSYYFYNPATPVGYYTLSAIRCTSGGKAPQGSSDFSIGWIENVVTGNCSGGASCGWHESNTWASRDW
jgi:prepilin-type N-terminal cleavage/methylation domain-containing protein